MKQGSLLLADGNKASLSKMKQHLRKEDRLAATNLTRQNFLLN